MGCSSCGGRKAGVKYEVTPRDGSPVVRVDTAAEALKITTDKGGTVKAVPA